MTLIVLAWAVQFLVLVGWGRLIRRAAAIGDLGEDDWYWTPWAGAFGIFVFCMGWHFVAPLGVGAALAIAVLAAAGWCRREVWSPLPGRIFLGDWRTQCLVLPALLLCLYHARQAPSFFDSAAYHLASIRWSNEYKILPGLGNVNGHYAFNNVHHLYHAVLEAIFGTGRSSHLVASFFWLWFWIRCAHGATRLLRGRSGSESPFFAVLLLPAISWEMAVMEPASDLPASLFLVSAGALAWNKLVVSQSLELRQNALRLLFILCAGAAMIKLSSLAPGLLLSAFGAYALCQEPGRLSTERFRPISRALLLAGGGFVLWMIRSSWLSGYPLFPFTAVSLPVAWKIPDEYAQWFPYWIRTFARVPFLVNDLGQGWGWIPSWLQGPLRMEKFMGIMPVTLCVVLFLPALLVCRRAGGAHRRPVAAAFTAAICGAIATWFLSAPAIRFGTALLWLLVGCMWALALGEQSFRRGPALARVLWLCLALIGLLERSRVNLTLPAMDARSFQMESLPEPTLKQVRLRSGLLFHSPAKEACPGEDWKDCLAWRPPLPGGVPVPEDLAVLSPERGVSGGFRTVLPVGGWVRHYAAAVQQRRSANNSSIRELTLYFRVPPELIYQALAWPPS